MTMEDTSASGIGVEVICHFQMEVLFSVPLAGMQSNDRSWNSHLRPEVSNTDGRCKKKEVGPISVQRPALLLYERELKLYCI